MMMQLPSWLTTSLLTWIPCILDKAFLDSGADEKQYCSEECSLA